MTGGDPSSSARHIKGSAVEQVGRAGGQPWPMEAGRRGGGGRSITPKSRADVKWLQHGDERGEERAFRRLMAASSGLLSAEIYLSRRLHACVICEHYFMSA